MDFSITKEKFIINGQEKPLLSGEIHYFRMPVSAWEPALDKLVEAGCNAVAYYVPWFVHQPQEDVFDFRGTLRESNDLHKWIALTEKKGLIGILRPGPYVYAETRDLGLPRWFTAKYPQSHPTRFSQGEYQNYGFERYASHNNPDFLACTRRWYQAVMKEIRSYLAPQGNVWMIQLCNEIPGDDNMDENPLNLGIGDKNGLFPTYLAKTYQDAQGLSRAYGKAFEALEQVHPHELREADPKRWERDKLAYYYTHYYPIYFQRLRAYLGELPKEVTLFHNAYNPKAISLHVQNQQENPWLNVGVDNYYSLFGNLSLREGVYFCEYGAQYAKTMLPANPPWVIEQECGYWHDYPQAYGPELYIYNLWTFAGGWKGINMYLFAGGVNDSDMGFFGTAHNWQAPVDKTGAPTETYASIQKSLADIQKDYPVLSAENRYDIALGIPTDPGLIWTPLANAAKEAYFALRMAGFTPRVVDCNTLPLEALKALPGLFLVSGECMPRKTQEKIAAAIAAGLPVVLNGRIPTRDEHRNPCTVLAQALHLEAEECAFGPAEQEQILWDDVVYFIGQTVQPFRGEGTVLGVETRENAPAILLGKNWAVAPFALENLFVTLAELTEKLMKKLGVIPLCRTGRYLLPIPKASGHTVVLNPHPCQVTETIGLPGGQVTCTLEPYSYQIL